MAGRKKVSSREKARQARRPLEERKADALTELAEVLSEEDKALLETRMNEFSADAIPGQIVKGIKKGWTFQDFVARWPIQSFTPAENLLVTLNGIPVQFRAGIEMHVPSIFIKAYNDRQRNLMNTGRKLPDLGYETVIELGAGALPPQ